MTGFMCSHMRHRCTKHGCYLDLLPSWDDIINCFPGKIRPTDVDGMVEINGQVLFLEEKRRGVLLEEGQRRALWVLSRLPEITVVFFRPGEASDLDVLIYDNDDPRGFEPYTRTEFLDWVHRWAVGAERRRAA